jgi:hypothetical protein
VEVEAQDIAEWVQGISQCQATEALLDYYYPLYAGFMCNQDGSGVDIALFLDEDCSIYTSKASFKKVASEDDQLYMYEAASLVQYPFLNRVNCNGEIQYITPDQYEYQAQNYNYYANNNYQEAGQVSEFCQSLFEGGDAGGAVSLRDCNADGQQDNQEDDQFYNYNQEDDQYQQAQEDQSYVTQYYSEDYYWYSYILSYENSQDNEATCQIINSMQGEYEYIYRWSGSGQLYDYGNGHYRTTTSDNVRNFFSIYEHEMEAVLIASIVLVAVIAVIAVIAFMFMHSSAPNKFMFMFSSAPNKYARHKKELDAKRERLVDERTGDLA